MSTFRVHFIQSVSTAVEVDAEDYDAAVEAAHELVPAATNSSNHGVDASGEWIEVSVSDESGEEVWSGYPQDEVAQLRKEIAELRTQLDQSAHA